MFLSKVMVIKQSNKSEKKTTKNIKMLMKREFSFSCSVCIYNFHFCDTAKSQQSQSNDAIIKFSNGKVNDPEC